LSYVLSHWRGEQTLLRSYWVNGAFISILFNYIDWTIWSNVPEEYFDPSLVFIISIGVYILIILTLTTWQLVGIWRSSGTQIDSTRRYFWPSVARMMVIVGIFSVASTTNNWVKLGIEHYQIVFGDLYSTYVVNFIENTDIILDGHISFDSTMEVATLLEKNQEIEVLQLRSPGGLLGAAEDLGNLVKKYDLIVIAYDYCYSACVMPLVASSGSTVAIGTAIGFHRAGGLDIADLDEAGANMMAEYFEQHGIASSIVDKMRSTPIESMWIPPVRTLVDGNVIDFVFDTDTWEFVDADLWCADNTKACYHHPELDLTK
jgi:hypothetical protein